MGHNSVSQQTSRQPRWSTFGGKPESYDGYGQSELQLADAKSEVVEEIIGPIDDRDGNRAGLGSPADVNPRRWRFPLS
jgi:hypothetical protein